MQEQVVKLNQNSLNSLFLLIQNRSTLKEFSRTMGVRYGTLRKWKAGKASMPYSLFCKIIKKYQVNKKSFDYELTVSKRHEESRLNEWVLLQKHKKIRTKATNTMYRKYGRDYFRKIGLRSAEKGYLTKKELEVHSINKSLCKKLQSKSHFTINDANYDLVYFKNNKPIFAEEVLGGRKKKSSVLFQIAKIQEKSERLRFPVIVTSWYKQNFNAKNEMFPLESVLWMLETNSLLPILLDVKAFLDFRTRLLSSQAVPSKGNLYEFCKKEIKNRYLLRGAKAEKNTSQNYLEKIVHELFKKHGFNPAGKKILRTKYDTYFVVDDFIPELNAAVMVTPKNIDDIIGQSFGIKTMCDDTLVTVGVLQNKTRYKKYKYERVKNRYVDHVFVGTKELEEWLKNMGS